MAKTTEKKSHPDLVPHRTERATALANRSEHPVYTFRIPAPMTKGAISALIREVYGFKPTRVNLIYQPAKRRTIRGRVGYKAGFKKALVALKPGETIDL